jgi:hypothetical protein
MAHPGKPIAPKPCWSKDEVEAERAAKAQAKAHHEEVKMWSIICAAEFQHADRADEDFVNATPCPPFTPKPWPPLHNKNKANLTVRGHLSISLPYLLYSLLSSSTLSTPTPLCAYVHIITKGRRPLSPIVDDHRILKSLILDFHLRSHLSHLGQASDTLGHVDEILRHPLRHVDLG